MSLLKEIIAEATGKTTDTPRLLRLCMVLAHKFNNEPLRTWARQELEGYAPDAPVPSYRKVRGRNQGYFDGAFRGEIDIPLSLLPEKLRPHYDRIELRDCIGEYAHLANGAQNEEAGLAIPWPPELALKYLRGYVTGSQCIRAWIALSPAELAGMIDKIKTKVLAFALEIEAEAPDAGDIESPTGNVLKEERVTQIFYTTIQGDVQNLATGGKTVTQTAIGTVKVGDIGSLMATLRTAGVSEDDLKALETALESDKEHRGGGIGEAVKGWIGDLLLKASSGVATIGADKVTSLVLQAIQAYLGQAT